MFGLFGSLVAAASWPVGGIITLGWSAKFLIRMFLDWLAFNNMYIPTSTNQKKRIVEILVNGVEVQISFEALKSSIVFQPL